MASLRELRLQQAIADAQTFSGASLRSIAASNDVDYSTLSRRLKGQLPQSTAHQHQQLLSSEQENLLKRWILDLELQGHAPSFNTVRELAGIVSEASGGPNKVGKNWISRFIQRHPEIRSKVGRKLQSQRVDCTSPQALATWFEHLQLVQQRYNILPQHAWNMDESGIALGVCNNQRVLGTTDTPSTYKKSPENREWVSIIETISATGVRLQPTVIFKGQNLHTRWFIDENVPDYQYTVSMNGWTSNEIGLSWLNQVFLPQTATDGPYRLLLVDGHKSHATFEFMWECFQNHVVVFYLLPHSSHVLQPLDLACFSPLKTRYRQQLTNLTRFDDTSAVKKAQFLQLYQKASSEGLTSYQIKAGWKASGIYPWNPRKAIQSRLVLQPSQQPPEPPSTPTSRKRRLSQSALDHTPRHRRDFSHSIQALLQQETISRPVRTFLSKVAKTIDRITWDSVQKDLQLAKQKTQIDAITTRKRKDRVIDCNEQFASIETIQAARAAVAALPAPTSRARRSTRVNEPGNVSQTAPPQDAFMGIFSLNDVVE